MPTSKQIASTLRRVAKTEGIELSPAMVKHLSESIANPVKQGHMRNGRKTHARFSKAGAARQSVEGFGHGMDVMGLTYGQFSLVDLIQATLEITGTADVICATWSAAFYDLAQIMNLVKTGHIRDVKFILDSGQPKKGQAGAVHIAEMFGEQAVVGVRTHAKFVIIRNDEWNVCITSSMNLNKNIRVEQFEMTDDADRCAMLLDFVETSFREAPPGRDFGRTMPALHTASPDWGVQALPGVARKSGLISMGKIELPAK